MFKKNRLTLLITEDNIRINTPIVDYSEVPKIRIYDAKNDGSYFYREIGFAGSFWQEEKK